MTNYKHKVNKAEQLELGAQFEAFRLGHPHQLLDVAHWFSDRMAELGERLFDQSCICANAMVHNGGSISFSSSGQPMFTAHLSFRPPPGLQLDIVVDIINAVSQLDAREPAWPGSVSTVFVDVTFNLCQWPQLTAYILDLYLHHGAGNLSDDDIAVLSDTTATAPNGYKPDPHIGRGDIVRVLASQYPHITLDALLAVSEIGGFSGKLSLLRSYLENQSTPAAAQLPTHGLS